MLIQNLKVVLDKTKDDIYDLLRVHITRKEALTHLIVITGKFPA